MKPEFRFSDSFTDLTQPDRFLYTKKMASSVVGPSIDSKMESGRDSGSGMGPGVSSSTDSSVPPLNDTQVQQQQKQDSQTTASSHLHAALISISKTGVVQPEQNWPGIRSYIRTEIARVFDKYKLSGVSPDEHVINDPLTGIETTLGAMIKECQERLDLFKDAAPFTVQRLAELILDPLVQYPETKPNDLIRAFTSILSVMPCTDHPVVDFDAEMAKDEQEQHGGNDAASGVLLSPISWFTPESPDMASPMGSPMGTPDVNVIDTGNVETNVKTNFEANADEGGMEVEVEVEAVNRDGNGNGNGAESEAANLKDHEKMGEGAGSESASEGGLLEGPSESLSVESFEHMSESGTSNQVVEDHEAPTALK